MSDAFEEIQAIKIKRNSLREKLQKRKRERHELFTLTSATPVSSTLTSESPLASDTMGHSQRSDHSEYERDVLCILHESLPNLPITSAELIDQLRKNLNADVSSPDIHKILEKLAAQDIVKIKEVTENGVFGYTVLSVAESQSSYQSQSDDTENPESAETSASELNDYVPAEKQPKLDKKNTEDIMSLISMPTIREKENKKGEPKLWSSVLTVRGHTDESLGDCSFLNTCFHMDTCKYVHYEVDGPTTQPRESNEADSASNSTLNKGLTVDSKNGSNTACPAPSGSLGSELTLYPPQWIQCDLRYLDMTVLGKFAVIMADPPWDIHMELPYGTMSDDEMRQLGIPALQDEGLLFLWVTGRAMELGRECLQLWGYERVDEIIWVKTNQLQRIIRTGRTGHWLNHGKEHCLVGMKGNPRINRGLDSDVIVAEVRATSHKPDEIYGIIERMSPGTRKIELFGRPHNVQPNWITLGNQVDGVHLIDPQLIKAFKKRYPDGNSMKPSKP
ncbi:N6-adenosine-methyltransferase MT-A70-like protein [Anthophora retusa]